jgi:hypothetical protein
MGGGLFVGFITGGLGFMEFTENNPMAGGSLLIVAVASVGNGVVCSTLFRAAAEAIRLLRAINTGRG